MAAVKPAWGAMSSTVKALRPKIEEKLKEGLDPSMYLEHDMTIMSLTLCQFVSPQLSPAFCLHDSFICLVHSLIVLTVEKDVRVKIQDAIMAQLNPGLEKFVAPHLSKIIDIIAYPVRSAEFILSGFRLS
jgi:hypothetical protein